MSSQSELKKSWMIVPLVAVALGAAVVVFLSQEAPATAQQDDAVLAEVGGVKITRETVEETVFPELQSLEQQRYQVMERGLEQAIESKLIDLEAASREISRDELLAEIGADLEEPSAEAVDAFYEANKQRINQPKDQIADQIAEYLSQTGRAEAYQAFLAELKSRYEVSRMLEPMRIEIAAAEYSPAVGKDGAPVLIVEFSDFQCPYCQRLVPTLDKVVETYGDKVQLVFRQFPLDIHNNALKAAEASFCAAEAGKFWEMHDKMFADINALTVDELKASAGSLELDAEDFAECLDSGRFADQVALDMAAGRRAGVTGTPALFINGRFLSGAQPFDVIAAVIDDELERESRQ